MPASKRVSASERFRGQVDELLASGRELSQTLEEVARLGVALLFQTAFESEVTEFLGRNPGQAESAYRPNHNILGRSTIVKTSEIRHIATAALAAFGVAAVGSLTWGALLVANLRISPGVPWSVPAMGLVLLVFWHYFGGSWWPRRTAAARRDLLRSRLVPRRVLTWAVVAGLLALVALAGLWMVLVELTAVGGNPTLSGRGGRLLLSLLRTLARTDSGFHLVEAALLFLGRRGIRDHRIPHRLGPARDPRAHRRRPGLLHGDLAVRRSAAGGLDPRRGRPVLDTCCPSGRLLRSRVARLPAVGARAN
jgi:hypothetical protein